MKYTIVNEAFIPSEKASLLISDLAIQRGYGIFDFFKTINNKPVFLNYHLDRLYSSAAEMRLPISLSRSALEDIIRTLIEKNQVLNSGIRITVTGGYSPDGYAIGKPNLVITQLPLDLKEDITQQGIKLITYPHVRQLPNAKTLDYMMAIWLRPVIEEKKADEVLYFSNGLITECPRANFFIVTSNDKVLTPRDHVLKGVIRKNVLQLAGNNIEVSERTITLDDLKTCKEAFITSTTRNIFPVIKIDGREVGDGRPGKITILLSRRLLERIHS